tara:strand:- start:765 stop:1829 length:1065 start_codon:yes stop_codon:yes gene_type:complete
MTTMQRGKIQFRTCFSSVCPSGHKCDVVKSGLQKYLRRRETDKMLWCAAELYSFHPLAETDGEKRAARGLVTNLVNRLTIMMDEELLFADWGHYLVCSRWLEEFEAKGRDDFEPIVKVCTALCGARLLRLNSDIRAYWKRGPGRGETGPEAKCGLWTGAAGPRDADWTANGGREAMDGFVACLDAGHPAAYKWAYVMMEMGGKGAPRYRRKEPVYAVWEALMVRASNWEHSDAAARGRLLECLERKLRAFHVKTRSERHIWLMAAISLVLHRDAIDWSPVQEHLAAHDAGGGELVEHLLRERGFMEIDEYAIDQHCSAGRSKKRGRGFFLEEGAKVVQEDEHYLVPEWRAAYMA